MGERYWVSVVIVYVCDKNLVPLPTHTGTRQSSYPTSLLSEDYLSANAKVGQREAVPGAAVCEA
jgi:hypothetical protein